MQLNIRTSTGARKSCKKGILVGLRKVETMKRRKRKMADRAAWVGWEEGRGQSGPKRRSGDERAVGPGWKGNRTTHN